MLALARHNRYGANLVSLGPVNAAGGALDDGPFKLDVAHARELGALVERMQVVVRDGHLEPVEVGINADCENVPAKSIGVLVVEAAVLTQHAVFVGSVPTPPVLHERAIRLNGDKALPLAPVVLL